MFEIVAAHGIPYAATASIGYLNDFIRKVEHAATIRGTKYIHVMAPCPTGWGCDVDETVDISKDIVDCGLWYLAEYEDGAFKLNRNPREFASVEAYLRRKAASRLLPTRTSPRWKPPATRSGRSCGETGRSETQYRHEQDEGASFCRRRPSFLYSIGYKTNHMIYSINQTIDRRTHVEGFDGSRHQAHRRKYGLTQQGFARLLGLGEASVVRYENGQTPSKANANLIRAADNPAFMRDASNATEICCRTSSAARPSRSSTLW